MFTGIVEAAVSVAAFETRGGGARLVLPSPELSSTASDAPWSAKVGDSVAVSGACLTVADFVDPTSGKERSAGPGAALAFDLSSETLARTWFGELARPSGPARRVNLERALRLGERLGGHLVSGHVDGTGRVVALADEADGGRRITFEVEPGLERYLISKGSVTLDGVSLTVVDPVGPRFDVALIPLTLEVTTLGELVPGDRVHVETDLVGKWIERLAVR